ncbi:MAG TPA: NifB/NifX family molybdenum-iron cluster-binding protein [Desulfomonilaceae bacterium]|nr:NifB/NifX family molybdenum-iron cluster-binding protein [Desulfomonilaceae bacterium]
MSKTIAVPSMHPGGLNARTSGHFGQCDVFTLVELDNSDIGNISVVQNAGHEHGGCLAPVGLLHQNGANALIVGGIGMRPLKGFHQMGIEVYFGAESGTVADAIDSLLRGRLQLIGDEQVCRGGCSDH